MDNTDNQLKELFSQFKSEDMSSDFSEKVFYKITQEKERKAIRRENINDILIVSVTSVVFIICTYLINRYFFHIEIRSLANKAMKIISGMKEALFVRPSALWTIITINSAILILLEQLLSRKFSDKIQ